MKLSINEKDLDTLTEYLLVIFGKEYTDLLSKSKRISVGTLFKLLLQYTTIEEVSQQLGVTRAIVEHLLSRKLRGLCGKHTVGSWSSFLLNELDMGFCVECASVIPKPNLSKDSGTLLGHKNLCEPCKSFYNKTLYANNLDRYKEYNKTYYAKDPAYHIARAAEYRASITRQCPAWADKSRIREIYRGCPPGHHVDHIVPLHGKLVSGLHVEHNLQYLPASENISKGNSFKIE